MIRVTTTNDFSVFYIAARTSWRGISDEAKHLTALGASDREKLYLSAVAALYKDPGASTRLGGDEHYRDAMAAVYVKYPDDETKLLYGLSILGAIPEGAKGFVQQGEAARLFEDV